MALIKFTRCRIVGDGPGVESEEMPLPTRQHINDHVLPAMDEPDSFIFSYSELKTLVLDEGDGNHPCKVGLVAYSLPGRERKYQILVV